MSNFRNIIARRRPSVPGAGAVPARSTSQDPLVLNDPVEPGEARDAARHKAVKDARYAQDVPRWTVEEPQATMEQVPTPQTPAPASRPKIWDMDSTPAEDVDTVAGAPAGGTEPVNSSTRLVPDDGPPAVAAPELPVSSATPAAVGTTLPASSATPPAVRPTPPAVGTARPRTGRVKTRLLGFHSDDLIPDAFAAEAAPAAAPTMLCPVGWVVVVDGPGRGASFALGSGLSMIGRGEDQTISLDFGDTSISRDNHASIAYDEEDNKVLIGHGGKSNLVRLNGKPLLSTEALNNADHIRIGKTILRYVALCGADFSWVAQGAGEVEGAPDDA